MTQALGNDSYDSPDRYVPDEQYIDDNTKLNSEIEYPRTETTYPSGPAEPDVIAADPSRFYNRRIIPTRRIRTITRQFYVNADGQAHLLLPPNPNRVRVRTLTDINNSAPIGICTSFTTDAAAMILFAPDSDWFEWVGTEAFYCYTTTSGWIYTVEESTDTE